MALYELTGKKFKLLEVLINPEHILKTVEEKCNLANISRTTYYKYFQDAKFCQALEKARSDILKSAVLPAIHQMIKAAKGKSFNDRKLLFEMAGVYTPKSEMSAKVDGLQIVLPEGIKPDDI